jgi:hypothetical protein
MKRILALILFILVTIGIGYGIYAFFFRGLAEPEVVVNGVNANVGIGGLPTAVNGAPTAVNVNAETLPPTPPAEVIPTVSPVAAGGITAVTPLTRSSTIGASISSNGNISYYDRVDGKFYRIGPDGTVDTLSDKVFHNIAAATFDPAGNMAVIEYPDGSNITYDFSTSTQVTLPRHWEDFAFEGDSKSLVAKSMALDDNSKFLIVSNPDGSGARPVQELGANADKVEVAVAATGHVIATAATGRKFGVDRQEIYMIGQNGENYKSLVVEGLNFSPKWNPSGSQLLYDVTGSASDWKPQLWIVDAQGDAIGANRKSINLNTWVEKCTFQEDRTVYCAVPRELSTGAGLDPTIAQGTPDDIYKVDLNTGLTSKIAIPEGSHSVGSIMLSPDGSNLYFTESLSGVLNKVKLK